LAERIEMMCEKLLNLSIKHGTSVCKLNDTITKDMNHE